MLSKPLNWLRLKSRNSRIKYAAGISFVVLVVLFGVVQAGGPMRPQPPNGHGWGGPQGPGMGGPGMGGPGMSGPGMNGPGMGQMGPQSMGMWAKVRNFWYPTTPVPTIKIIAVVEDESVTFETKNYPADQEFTVTMGKMYTRGINGIEVGTFNSGDGGTFQQTFEIPEDLYGQYKISIRAQTDHAFPYYSFNWFYNNTTETTAAPAEEPAAEETEAAPAEETTDEAAAEETTTETAEEPSGEAAAESPQLVGQVWQWEEFTDPVNGTQEIEGPEKYLIEFLDGGGLNIQADCNVGNGTYEAGDDGTLSISIGAMTLALCEPDSLSDQFVNNLSAAAVYFFADGNLYIDLAFDSGTMMFGPNGEPTAEGEAGTGGADTTADEAATTGDEAAATEGEATTTEGEATTTEGEATTTEGEATTTEGEATTTEGEATTTEGEESMAEEPALTGTVWQWAEFTDPVQGTVAVENPELYTAEFLEDGTVNVQADCNSGRGSYTADGSSITISDLAMTRALCAEGSLSDQFVEYLSAAAIYFFEDGDLFFDLPADTGTMMFTAASEESTAVPRGSVYKVVRQDDAEADEDTVPSFIICSVVADESVTIQTENFPADQEFKVQMGPMPAPMQMPNFYGPGPMSQGMGMDMGPQSKGMGGMPAMGPPSQGMGGMPAMGPQSQGMGGSMPAMGPPSQGMGGPDMKGMWGGPMGEQKVWIPYFDAGTFESGDGGSLTATFDIPVDYLYGTPRISIVLRTAHENPYIAYNWFYNNDAEVCDNVD